MADRVVSILKAEYYHGAANEARGIKMFLGAIDRVEIDGVEYIRLAEAMEIIDQEIEDAEATEDASRRAAHNL